MALFEKKLKLFSGISCVDFWLSYLICTNIAVKWDEDLFVFFEMRILAEKTELSKECNQKTKIMIEKK